MAGRRIKEIKIEKMWLTVGQLQEYLGFGNRATQQEWRDSGLLPYYRIGKVIVYNKNEIDDFVKQYKQSNEQNESRTINVRDSMVGI